MAIFTVWRKNGDPRWRPCQWYAFHWNSASTLSFRRRYCVKGDRSLENRAVLLSIFLLIIGSGGYRRRQARHSEAAVIGKAGRRPWTWQRKQEGLLGKSKHLLFSRNLQLCDAGTPEACSQRKRSPTRGRRWWRWRRSNRRGRKGTAWRRSRERRTGGGSTVRHFTRCTYTGCFLSRSRYRDTITTRCNKKHEFSKCTLNIRTLSSSLDYVK